MENVLLKLITKDHLMYTGFHVIVQVFTGQFDSLNCG